MIATTTFQRMRSIMRHPTMRDGSLVFASTMVVNVFNYLYHMFCSRILGVSAYGSLATLVAAYSILNALPIILTTTTVKLAAELHAVDDKPRIEALMRTIFRFCLAIVGVLFVVFLITGRMIAQYVHIDFWALAMSLLAIATAIIVPATRGILQGVQDYAALAVATTVECLLRLLAGAGAAYLGFGPTGAMAGFAVGSFVSLLYSIFAVRKHIKHDPAIEKIHLDTRRLFITSQGVALATIALTTLGFIDVIMVKHFFSPQDAGLYGVLSLAGKVIIFSVSFIPTILLPKAVNKVAKGESARSILSLAALATAGLAACSLAIFFFAPVMIVRIMAGPAFIAAAPYVFWYGVATSLLSATTLAATYHIGLHRFAFIPRLVIVMLGEIIGIALYHGNVAEVIRVVVIANAVGLAVTILPSPPRLKATRS